jgi:two-component system, cell cycle response regulator
MDASSVVLVLTADQAVRESLQDTLGMEDFSLTFAENLSEAVGYLSRIVPLIIVIDQNFAGNNSEEVFYRLRSYHHLTEIPILLLSENDDGAIRLKARAAGVEDFLIKPIDGLELQTRLKLLAQLSRHRALLHDAERQRWMFEHSYSGMLKLDKDGMISYANETARRMLNLPEAYHNLNFMQQVESLYEPHPQALWQNWLQNPLLCYLTLPETEHARAQWLVVDSIDTPEGIEFHRRVRLRDVTEKMLNYQDMRKFHTTVAHKLRTPISIMVSNLSVLKSQIDKIPPEEIRDYVGGMIGGADRLVREVRDILTYIDAPLSLNVGEPVALAALTELIVITANTLDIQDINISIPQEYRSIRLALTETALELIVEELLENAKKFHPRRTPAVEFSVAQDSPGFLTLRFVDDGLTLSPEQLSWAWLPYFQGEKDFSGETPGMGLGLPLVATLVWQSGGTVHMNNRSDGQPGVVVSLTIPTKS